MNNQPPFLFFAFSNAQGNRYLPDLKREERGIFNELCFLKHFQNTLNFEHLGQTSAADLFDTITTLRNKITVLHYSGHADSLSLEFDDGAYSIGRLCLLISEMPNLKLVFLNGCSTGGMVDLLLQQGIKAVIATSEKIEDNRAYQFSLKFYQAFSKENTSLKAAFSSAISTLKNVSTKKEDYFVTRDTALRKEYAKKKKIPWALYYKKENRVILEWKLVQETKFVNLNGDIKEKILAKRQLILNEDERIVALMKELKKFEEIIKGLGTNNPAANGLKELILDKQGQICNLEQKADELYQNLKQTLKNQYQSDLEERFKTALFHLNYHTQIKYFEQKFKSVGAYLLQGSPNCGQGLLTKRLLDFAGFPDIYKDEFYKKVVIDFSAQTIPSYSNENIWSMLAKELLDVNSMDPKGISKEIYEKYLSKKSLILVFNNIHQATPQFIQQLIKGFWCQFIDMLKPLLNRKVIPNKLLLFMIDTNCQFVKEKGQIISAKEMNLRTVLSKENFSQYPTHILPIITPLDAKVLDNWKFNQGIPLDMELTEEVFQQILGSQKGYMLPSIKSLCESTDMEEIYYRNFQQYEYQTPTL